nr:zinc finger and SCAN domain-containing protein 5B-like [Loxodonta africana]
MAVDLTSSWRHGKPSEDCGSESPQLMSSQEADLGEKDYDPETWHVNFRAFTSSEGADPIGDLKRLSELCRLWLRPDLHTKEQILDKLVLEQFMISMPLDLQVLVKESGVKNCKDLEEMLRNNRRPVTWSVVCLQGQEFLLPNPDVQMAGSEASDMDDVSSLSREPHSCGSEIHPENRRKTSQEHQNFPGIDGISRSHQVSM